MNKRLVTTVAGLLLAASGQAKTSVYDNGPVNGTIEGPGIANGLEVSDSFTVSGKFNLTSADVGVWDWAADPLDTGLSSVSWSIGTTPFGSDISSGVATVIQNTALNIPGSGLGGEWSLYDSTFDLSGIVSPGTTYYFTLDNALVPGGNNVGWDINNGPSTAYGINPYITGPFAEQNLFAIGSGSEAFKLYGSVPDNGLTVAMLGTVITGLAFMRPRRRV